MEFRWIFTEFCQKLILNGLQKTLFKSTINLENATRSNFKVDLDL